MFQVFHKVLIRVFVLHQMFDSLKKTTKKNPRWGGGSIQNAF